MAYIDVDEPAPEQPQPPAGQIERAVSPKPPRGKSTKLSKKLFYGLAVLAAVFVVFQFIRLNKQAKQLEKQVAAQSTTEQAKPDQEAQILADKIGQYLELPDEVPTVATVTDASKVSNQLFFARAQDDDKVLLFEKSGRAVLYRPSTNKVIEFATTN